MKLQIKRGTKKAFVAVNVADANEANMHVFASNLPTYHTQAFFENAFASGKRQTMEFICGKDIVKITVSADK